MKKLLKQTLTNMLHVQSRRGYERLYARIRAAHPDLSRPADDEDEWLARWRRIDPKVSPAAYRIFSRYVGPDPRILPCESGLAYIEPVLNPLEMRPYYSDKNMFDKIFGPQHTVSTIVRQINGVYYTPDYQPIAMNDTRLNQLLDGHDEVIVKPSVDGESGRGVQRFAREAGGQWTNPQGDALTPDYLAAHYRGNVAVQPLFRQHDSLARFNPTSVNTLRIFVLRRPATGECVVPAAVLRIGAKGSTVDNAHGGGRFVGILPDGTLRRETCDQFGTRADSHNGIDFRHTAHRIPAYDAVLDFARAMGGRILHHHILAFDICLAADGSPRVMEVNVHGFGGWVFQFGGQATFGPYTDEVIDWCLTHRPRTLALIRS